VLVCGCGGDGIGGAVDVAARDIEMSDHANPMRPHADCGDAVLREARAEILRGTEACVDGEEDHVGGNGFGRAFEGETAGFCDDSCESPCIGVIVGEARDMVVERVDRGGCEQTRLAHCTAEHLAKASRAGDELCTTSKSAANRRAEAFGEADGNAVDARGEGRWRDAERDACVHQARAVDVHMKPTLAASAGDGFELRDRPNGAAALVVGVLDDEHARDRVVLVAVANRGADLRGIEEPARTVQWRDHAA